MERILVAPDLEIRPADFLALARGRALRLSLRELELLAELARTPDRVIPRAELYARVWGGELRDRDRSVDAYVHKLRAKLALALPEWHYIHTHFGLGYRFTPERRGPVTGVSQVGNGSVTSYAASPESLAS